MWEAFTLVGVAGTPIAKNGKNTGRKAKLLRNSRFNLRHIAQYVDACWAAGIRFTMGEFQFKKKPDAPESP
jgi:hypothetical protein